MRHFLKLLAISALVAAAEAAGAQDIRINPVPPDLKPQWTQVPGAPQVSWAPNLPTDVFRYRGNYYFFWENYLYRGHAPQGPWKAVVKVPKVFYDLDPSYFKTVKKTGEAPAAPGASAPSPKAKIIDIPPTAPPELAPQDPPSPEETPAKPPKVM
ncbi:MAG: hypothetical protein FJ121_00520 [Deltaproteobacteria bacterium]|nr:hypothetical protein [Deltaproteobacteria bacterium]